MIERTRGKEHVTERQKPEKNKRETVRRRKRRRRRRREATYTCTSFASLKQLNE